MQIVIDISEEYYGFIKNNEDRFSGSRIYDCVLNGTVLPKNHGRLIDASQLYTVTECLDDGTERCYVPYEYIEDAPSILDMEVEG